MSRRTRWVRWFTLLSIAGMLPAFVLRCDKAALNFQRGFLQGLGEDAADLVVQFAGNTQEME